MLNLKQLQLLVHLKQYIVADKEICALFIDDYVLRPLIRYKYISHCNGVYRLLKKGFEMTKHIQPLVTVSGNAEVIERVLKTSRLAAVFASIGIRSAGVQRDNVFIPSNKWREIRKGITSTARFNGVLCYKGMRLAVYDIGNGDMEWQSFAEGSLFFRKYGTYETRMTGMLWVCDGNEISIAEKVLRNTISNRKVLMKRTKLETDKKWAYSFRPICVRPNYERVYITDRSNIAETLNLAANEDRFIDYFADYLEGTKVRGEYDVEVHPTRYIVNPQGDLLKFAKAYNTVKSFVKFYEDMKRRNPHVPGVKYHILVSQKHERLARLYDLPMDYSIVKGDFIKEFIDETNSEKH